MKIDVSEIANSVPDFRVRIGNVYPSKGGRGNTAMFAIVAMTDNGNACHALGLDVNGNIVTTTSYGVHVFESRPIIGYIPELESLTIKVRPMP